MRVAGYVFAMLYDCAQIFDRSGACIYANRAAAACLGLTPNGMIGKTWRELGQTSASAAIDARRETVFATGEPLLGEVMMATGHGDRIYEYTLNPIVDRDNSVEAVIYLARDVTERKRDEDAERQAFQEAVALNAHLRRAVRAASHRIKNHLQLLAGIADLQLLNAEELVPAADVRRWIGHVRTVAAVHDLLFVETGEDAATDAISIRSLLEEVVALFEATVGPDRIHFASDDIHLPIRVATSVALIANELVTNAVKHGARETQVQLRAQGGMGRLEVTDDGPGLQEGFEPNAAVHTGLEMIESLARWDLHGQTRFESLVDGGTRVTVTMPLA